MDFSADGVLTDFEGFEAPKADPKADSDSDEWRLPIHLYKRTCFPDADSLTLCRVQKNVVKPISQGGIFKHSAAGYYVETGFGTSSASLLFAHP